MNNLVNNIINYNNTAYNFEEYLVSKYKQKFPNLTDLVAYIIY
jgi:hypothetical protein